MHISFLKISHWPFSSPSLDSSTSSISSSGWPYRRNFLVTGDFPVVESKDRLYSSPSWTCLYLKPPWELSSIQSSPASAPTLSSLVNASVHCLCLFFYIMQYVFTAHLLCQVVYEILEIHPSHFLAYSPPVKLNYKPYYFNVKSISYQE